MSEAIIQRRVWMSLGAGISRIFRLNTGMGWISALGPRGVHHLPDGSVRIEQARPIALGLGSPNGRPVAGAADLVGWTPKRITPEHVGRQVAVFTSVEVKAARRGCVRAKQHAWRDALLRDGAIAAVARSPEEAHAAVEGWGGAV